MRQKYVSQVVGYCPAEVSKGQLLRDSQRDFERNVRAECGQFYEISFEYVPDSATREQADAEREKSLNESGYRKHVSWYASLDYYSSKCR